MDMKLDFKYIIKNIVWYIYGRTVKNPDISISMKSILFVCKGNICRSNFAEKLSHIKYNISNEYLLGSAGIYVKKPVGVPDEATIAASKYGVMFQNHKSKQLDYSLMEASDLVVVMEKWQYEYLRKIFLEFRNKIFLLPLIDSGNPGIYDQYSKYNIQDPYGRNISSYIECYGRIERCIDIMFSRINN
jgi:protein-tyrosine phosphatase